MCIRDSPLLPAEIWNEIISHGKSDLVALSCVTTQLNQLANDYAKNPEGCFGEKEWKHFNGDPGIVFPIPLKMVQDFDPSKFILAFIPETLNGEPLTLTSFDEFIKILKNSDKSNYRAPLRYQGISNETVGAYKSHWVMLSKDILGGDDSVNGTRNMTFEIQEKLVKAEGFEIPNLIDVVVSLFMHNLKTGIFLYPDDSNGHKWTYICVQEQINDDYRIVVGGFSALGLFVDGDGYEDVAIGAACSLKSGHPSLDS